MSVISYMFRHRSAILRELGRKEIFYKEQIEGSLTGLVTSCVETGSETLY